MTGWDKARDQMLGALLGRPLWVAIFHGTAEEPDPGYRRARAQFIQDGDSDGMRIFSNAADVPFPPLREDTESDATAWALFDAEVGGEQITPLVPFDRPRRLLRTDNYVARARDLRIAIA